MTDSFKKIIPQNDKQAFWLSFFLCLFFSSIIIFVVAPVTGLSKNFGSGNDGYIQIARNFVAGNGYVFEKGGPPVFHRPPMYPLFLVPVALFPEYLQRYIIIIPQSILVGFIGMMIFKIARQLYNQNIASIALLLFLINPWVYWNAKNPMTAILQTFLYLIFTYCVGKNLFAVNGFKPYRYGLFLGLSGAALILSHAAMLPVAILLIGVIFFVSVFKCPKKIYTAVISIVLIVILVAPWTYRNWIVFQKFIPVAGGGGLAFFNGNVHWQGVEEGPQKKGESYIDASARVIGIDGNEATLTHWKGFKNIEHEQIANQQMTEFIKNNPGLFAKKITLNAIEYYFPAFTKNFLAIKSVTIESWALSLFHLFLWITALAGVFFYRKKGLLLILCIILYDIWYFPFATFIGHSLYTLGTIPFLSILAAAGIISLFRLFSSISARSR
ncbi:MAG: hypothetical protein A2Y10_07080 [Planctomycetes bacterium GWF2_41_51]|nr:MAG: hypothetical protein A2Y10_07080 [Planctomycetes bacterium GWF2_41_51]HBG28772.1 hypothetical protein [Phycisphaerales bacterium]